MVDTDGSGEIDRDELQQLLIELEHPLALDDYCVDDLFRRTDKDGSGHIDFPEFCDLVYVELHDDIGLPHTLYNVGSGVLPSILRRWRRGPTPSPRRHDHAGPPPQAEEGALEVRETAKYLRDEARPFENVAGRAPQGHPRAQEGLPEGAEGHDVPAS